jgi:hypothetical protein
MSKTILAFPLLAAVLGEAMDPAEKFGPLTDKIEAGLQANADSLTVAEASIVELTGKLTTATADHTTALNELNGKLATAETNATNLQTALTAAEARATAAENKATTLQGEFDKLRNAGKDASADAGDLGAGKGSDAKPSAVQMFPKLAASMGVKVAE